MFSFVFQCHYSIQKAASALGIGSDNVIKVKTDSVGKMLVSDLKEKVTEAKAEVCVSSLDLLFFPRYKP